MKSRFLLIVALFGLVGSGIAFAQDSTLGKKGKGGDKGGGSGSGKGGGGGSGGLHTDPPPRQTGGGGGQSRGRGNSGEQSGGGSGSGRVFGGSTSSGSGGGSGRGSSGGTIRPSSGGGTVHTEDGTFGKRGNSISRSGHVTYEGSNNILGRPGTEGRITPRVYSDAPTVTSNKKIVREVTRENRIRVNDNRYRNGYYGYNRGWVDNNFSYPYYGFNWYDGCNYVTSPFYWYYHLPAYVDIVRVNIGPIHWVNCSTHYDWSPIGYDRYGYDSSRADLDYAVSDLQRSFERGNMRYIATMIPTRGRVEIDAGWNNQYTIDADDFYDMMRDLVEGTRTIDYRIVDVCRDGSRATVTAEHVYTDSWGREACVRHQYGLREGRRGFEIVYFKTDGRNDY
ncbi:MAG: hypothetical protein JSS66_02275 [Armatimonadetes bacterium]|nr:hypothetical protein [Armatimonadota bacterium]